MEFLNRIKKYGDLVMFSHTVFSLPFAIVAMLWAAQRVPETRIFVWILVALFGARNGANAFNRIADRKFDAKNPRTAERHIPKGLVSIRETYFIVIFCFIVMSVAAYMLNTMCLILLPLAIFIFVFYSYTKRFTWLCHIVLGIACGGAPIGAWIAVTGELAIPPLLLGMTVTCWISGFDTIYALQDIDFDRKEKLFSIPARFGEKNGRKIAAFLHICSVLLMVVTSFFVNVGLIYFVGVGLIAALLFVEHKQIILNDRKKMVFASYSINQIVAMCYLVFTITDFFLLI